MWSCYFVCIILISVFKRCGVIIKLIFCFFTCLFIYNYDEFFYVEFRHPVDRKDKGT